MFAALLWLTDRYGTPIRLLEIGASAGLNLLVDRYCYVVAGRSLGDPASPVRFEEPWAPGPDIDVPAATAALRISAREGCDLAPLDPRDPEDRVRLVSYIWPDEPVRIGRIRAALELAATAPEPPRVVAGPAQDWLPSALERRAPGELTVIWHSLVRQYVRPEEWAALELVFARATASDPDRPIVWLSMEPGADPVTPIVLSCREPPRGVARELARCDDHGPPLRWGSPPVSGPDQAAGVRASRAPG